MMNTVRRLGLAGLLAALVLSSGCQNQTGFVYGVIQINGSALSGNITNYSIEVGAGLNPGNWSTIGVNLTGNGSAQVNESVLGTWNTSSVRDGYHTIRLSVVDAQNITSRDLMHVFVDNIVITAPEDGAIVFVNQSINISGGAVGPGFQSFIVEYSPDETPFNWSIAGIVLYGNGSSPVSRGFLGSWNTSLLSAGKDYILRLTVNDSGGILGQDNITVRVNVECMKITQNTTLTKNYTSSSACILIETDDVVLDCASYFLVGTLVDWDYGIYINETSGVTVKNCVVEEYYFGIYVYNSSNTTIRNNTAHDNYYAGIYLFNATYNNITNNTANKSTDNGITVDYSYNNNISGNTASYSWDYGIYLYRSSDNTISENYITENIDYGIYVSTDSDRNNVSENTIEYNSDHGIYVRSAKNNTVTSNTVDNNSGYGLYMYLADANTLANNTVRNNTGLGIYLRSSENNNCTGNTLINDGIYLYGSSIDHFNTHNLDETNTFNGRPVRYVKNMADYIVPANSGQIILANTTNVTIENQSLNASSVGILSAYSSKCNINGNTAYDNKYGVILINSDSNTLIENTVTSSNNYGVYLESSNNNTLANNTINTSRYDGLYIDSGSYDNTILENNLCLNNQIESLYYYDIYDPGNTTGDNNTCNTAYKYNDTSSSIGCVNSCSASFPANMITGWNLISLPLSVT